MGRMPDDTPDCATRDAAAVGEVKLRRCLKPRHGPTRLLLRQPARDLRPLPLIPNDFAISLQIDAKLRETRSPLWVQAPPSVVSPLRL